MCVRERVRERASKKEKDRQRETGEGAYSFLQADGPLSLLSRPPKKPLTSDLAEVVFSSLSAMSFLPESQELAVRR